MTSNKRYAPVYDNSSYQWQYPEMEKLSAADWRDWIKDRLHQRDDLPGPSRIEETREDLFLGTIPHLKNKSPAINGLTLAYQDAIDSIGKNDWQPEALGAVILLVHILIVKGDNNELTGQVRAMTQELQTKITTSILPDNKARDPYTQATYLLENPGKQPDEEGSEPPYVDGWLGSHVVSN